MAMRNKGCGCCGGEGHPPCGDCATVSDTVTFNWNCGGFGPPSLPGVAGHPYITRGVRSDVMQYLDPSTDPSIPGAGYYTEWMVDTSGNFGASPTGQRWIWVQYFVICPGIIEPTHALTLNFRVTSSPDNTLVPTNATYNGAPFFAALISRMSSFSAPLSTCDPFHRVWTSPLLDVGGFSDAQLGQQLTVDS